MSEAMALAPASGGSATGHRPVVVDGVTPEPRHVAVPGGDAWVFVDAAPQMPGRTGDDAAAVAVRRGGRVLLAVADGVGSSRGAAAASRAAMLAVAAVAEGGGSVADALRVLNAELVADRRMGLSTVVVAELGPDGVRLLHAGDSAALLCGQRGRLKHRTVDHAPVGALVAAGELSDLDALVHEERHIVENVLGDPQMQLETAQLGRLAARDTLVLATDGVFDNLVVDEVVEIVRRGDLGTAARALADASRHHMLHPRQGRPGKPDDVAFVLFRPSRRRTSR